MGHVSPTPSWLGSSGCGFQGTGFTLAKIYWLAPQELVRWIETREVIDSKPDEYLTQISGGVASRL